MWTLNMAQKHCATCMQRIKRSILFKKPLETCEAPHIRADIVFIYIIYVSSITPFWHISWTVKSTSFVSTIPSFNQSVLLLVMDLDLSNDSSGPKLRWRGNWMNSKKKREVSLHQVSFSTSKILPHQTAMAPVQHHLYNCYLSHKFGELVKFLLQWSHKVKPLSLYLQMSMHPSISKITSFQTAQCLVNLPTINR